MMPFPQFTRPVHALVVDDDLTNLIVVRKLCGLFGGSADIAASGEQAVTLCATGAFDLVLMDVRMPRMNGLDAAVAIRALPGPVGQTPIIAVTGDATPETEALCFKAGMNGFVEKPIRSQKLFDAVEHALMSAAERLDDTERRVRFG